MSSHFLAQTVHTELLELDQAIREALTANAGERARDLTMRFCARIHEPLGDTPAIRAARARQSADLLANMRAYAEEAQERIRSELTAIDRQRQIIQSQRAGPTPSKSTHAFTA